MYYNESTGSYCNDFMEPLVDTGFLTDVPYKINKEKYNELLKKYNETSRFNDTDVVTFSTDYTYTDFNVEEENTTPYMYGFFVWSKNSPEGSSDFYDCMLFEDHKYDNKHKEAYENFIKEVTACIIGVDIPTAMAKKQELSAELKKKTDELAEFETVIKLANNKIN